MDVLVFGVSPVIRVFCERCMKGFRPRSYFGAGFCPACGDDQVRMLMRIQIERSLIRSLRICASIVVGLIPTLLCVSIQRVGEMLVKIGDWVEPLVNGLIGGIRGE